MAIRVPRKRADSYQHGDLRHALIQAGLKLLSAGGVRELSLRAAAQLAGVSHAAPYRHFRDKDALIAAIAEEGFRRLTERMREEIETSGATDIPGRLRASARGYVTFAVENPAYFRTIFSSAPCDTMRASLKAAGEEAYHVLRDLVVAGIEQGDLRPGAPDEVSLAMWSMVHGLSMLIIDEQVGPGISSNPAATRHLTETLVTALHSGVLAQPPKAPAPRPARR